MTVNNTPKTFAYYMGLSLKQIAAEYRRDFCIPAHKGINRSKAIVAMERKNDSKKSISSWMKAEFGLVDSNAFKPAKVFRELVAMNDEGETEATAGAGQITECQFDRITAITVMIGASAILGAIEAQYEGKPEGAAPFREDLAEILRTHDKVEDTLKALDVLKAKLKPVAKAPATPEEPTTPENEEDKKAEALPLTPVGLLALLHGEQGKATWRAIVAHAKANPAEAFAIAEAIQNIGENARKMSPVVLAFVPAPVEVAA